MANKPLTLSQINLMSSISILFRHDERLGRFFFHHRKPSLRHPPDELLNEAYFFSQSELVLVKIALDLWCSQGGVRLTEILNILDDENLIAVIRSILRFREIDIDRLNDESEFICSD